MDESVAVAAMADALVSSGAMTRAEVDAGMAADQIPVAEEGAGTAAPQPADEQKPASVPDPLAGYEIDPAFAPPSSPDDYRFQTAVGHEIELDDIKAARQLFHTAKMPQGIAQQVFSEVERMHLENRGEELSDAKLEMLNAQTMVQLRQAWGDRTDEMLGHGRRLVSEIAKTNPSIREFLDITGAGSNPVVVRQIAEHAARLYSSKRK